MISHVKMLPQHHPFKLTDTTKSPVSVFQTSFIIHTLANQKGRPTDPAHVFLGLHNFYIYNMQ